MISRLGVRTRWGSQAAWTAQKRSDEAHGDVPASCGDRVGGVALRPCRAIRVAGSSSAGAVAVGAAGSLRGESDSARRAGIRRRRWREPRGGGNRAIPAPWHASYRNGRGDAHHCEPGPQQAYATLSLTHAPGSMHGTIPPAARSQRIYSTSLDANHPGRTMSARRLYRHQ